MVALSGVYDRIADESNTQQRMSARAATCDCAVKRCFVQQGRQSNTRVSATQPRKS